MSILTPNLTRLFAFLLPPFLFAACSVPEVPVTKEEAHSFADKIEKSVANRNNVLLDNIFDNQHFAERVASEAGRALNKELIEGATKGIQGAHFGQQIIHALGRSGSYQLVKQYEKDHKQHLLFRLYGDGKVNYHDFELVKRDDKVKAADVFIYLSGENFSKTLAQALLMMQESMPNMSKKDEEKVTNIKTIKSLMSKGDYEKANSYYEQLPADFKKQKLFLLMHVQICEELGKDLYAKAMNEYRDLYPNDPNMFLMMIDAYVLQKDYPKALESINKLDSLIDKDPFQDYYRGLVYKLMRDTVKSRQCLERLHTNMPSFIPGTLQLIVNYHSSGDIEKAAKLTSAAINQKQLSEEEQQQIFLLYPDMKKAVQAAGDSTSQHQSSH